MFTEVRSKYIVVGVGDKKRRLVPNLEVPGPRTGAVPKFVLGGGGRNEIRTEA